MLSTLVIVALQYSRRVFWFSFGHWLSTPWFFSRSRTRLVFSFFFYPKNFFLFPLDRDSRYFFLLFLARGFLFFSGTVNTGRYLISKYIHTYIYTHTHTLDIFVHIQTEKKTHTHKVKYILISSDWNIYIYTHTQSNIYIQRASL